jgi:hypothetical protein
MTGMLGTVIERRTVKGGMTAIPGIGAKEKGVIGMSELDTAIDRREIIDKGPMTKRETSMSGVQTLTLSVTRRRASKSRKPDSRNLY